MSEHETHSVVLVGAGRMGTLIAAELAVDESFELVQTYDIDNINDLASAPKAELVIDFSAPSALPFVSDYIKRTGAALVSGTTGLSDEELTSLKELGNYAAVIHSPNYSLGVAALRLCAELAACMLKDFDAEIVETHHKHKIDAPSGTALALLAAIDPEGRAQLTNGRSGVVGARGKNEIGMHALRGGTVAGTHELHFFGTDEELVLTHRASSRQIFVNGAIAAAKRLVKKEKGFYSFDELLFDE